MQTAFRAAPKLMTDRERFLRCALGGPVDRAPFWLKWGPWQTTWKRWQREGMPPAARDLRAYFGADMHPCVVPVNCGPCPRIDREILSEDERFIVFRDGWGITRRDRKDGESMSEFLSFPVKTPDDWRRFRAERLDPDHPARLAGEWLDTARAWQAAGYPIQLGDYPDVGIFGCARWLLGDEEVLEAFYTMPELLHEIMEHMTSLYLAVFERVVSHVQVDVIHIWEDMCAKHGPLISPAHFGEFMAPCYRRIHAFAEKHRIPIISVDTDGKPDRLIPAMMACGVNLMFPFEVAAGCDVHESRSKYPTLCMMGGIDKRKLALDPCAIDQELQRVAPLVAQGRYIPELDHLVPDDVSWQNYVHYVRGLEQILGGTGLTRQDSPSPAA